MGKLIKYDSKNFSIKTPYYLTWGGTIPYVSAHITIAILCTSYNTVAPSPTTIVMVETLTIWRNKFENRDPRRAIPL